MTVVDACTVFRQIAVKIWNLLRSARVVELQLGEESITDLAVLELKKRESLDVSTRTFTTTAEGTNGADWEWWFKGRSGGYFGFRVQAKILNFASDSFEHLHYKSRGDSTYQADKLIRSALRSEVSLAPIYCLYANWDVSGVLSLFQSDESRLRRPPFGCSVMSAFEVRKLRLDGKIRDLESVISLAYPWHCIVCGPSADDLASRAHNLWQKMSKENEAGRRWESPGKNGLEEQEISELKELHRSLAVSESPPNHIALLETNDLVEPPGRDLAGIVLTREGKEMSA